MLLDGLALRNVSVKIQDAALEFGGLEAEGGGVEGAGDFPNLFGAARGGVDAFGVAARKRFVFFVADEKDREGARCDGLHRRNFSDGKAGEFFAAIEKRPAERSEKSFAKNRRSAQSGVIVGGFSQRGERGFRNDGFDARIGSGGLQRDAGAHGFAEGEDVGHSTAWGARQWNAKARSQLGSAKSVDDGAGVGVFEPAVGCDFAFACAVGAGVHHDDAVAGAKQEFGLG